MGTLKLLSKVKPKPFKKPLRSISPNPLKRRRSVPKINSKLSKSPKKLFTKGGNPKPRKGAVGKGGKVKLYLGNSPLRSTLKLGKLTFNCGRLNPNFGSLNKSVRLISPNPVKLNKSAPISKLNEERLPNKSVAKSGKSNFNPNSSKNPKAASALISSILT